MKKLFLILSILVFLNLASPVRGFGFLEELFQTIDLKEYKEEASIFADPSYTQPTHNFSPGQMVYVRAESPINGDREKTFRLLDSEKKEIQRLTLNQSGNLFTASFSAPDTAGVYYVDIKIEDSSGSKFASQENINVGETEGSVSVSSQAESTVIQGNELSPISSPKVTIQPEISPKPEVSPPLVEKSESFVVQIIEFFRKLFSHLTRLTGLDRLV